MVAQNVGCTFTNQIALNFAFSVYQTGKSIQGTVQLQFSEII